MSSSFNFVGDPLLVLIAKPGSGSSKNSPSLCHIRRQCFKVLIIWLPLLFTERAILFYRLGFKISFKHFLEWDIV